MNNVGAIDDFGKNNLSGAVGMKASKNELKETERRRIGDSEYSWLFRSFALKGSRELVLRRFICFALR